MASKGWKRLAREHRAAQRKAKQEALEAIDHAAEWRKHCNRFIAENASEIVQLGLRPDKSSVR